MTQIKQLDVVLNTASASIDYNNIIANSEQVKLGVNLLGAGVSYPAVPGLYKSGKSTISATSVAKLLQRKRLYSDSLALSYVLLNSTKGLGTQYAAASNVAWRQNKATLISATANSTLSKSSSTTRSSAAIATTSLVKSAKNASVSSALTQFALTKLIDKLLNSSSYTSSVLVNFLLNNTYVSSSQVQDNILNLVSIVKSSNATLVQSLVGLKPVLIKSSFVGSGTTAIRQVNKVTNSVQLTSTILSKAASAIHSSLYLVLSQPLLSTEKPFSSASQTSHLVIKQPNKFSNSNAQPAAVLFKGTSKLNSSLPASQDSSKLFFSKLSTTTFLVAEQGSATTQTYFETPASYLSTGDYVGTSYTI